jgi:hypothetical protein
LVKPILAELKEQDSDVINSQKVKARGSELWEDSIYKK